MVTFWGVGFEHESIERSKFGQDSRREERRVSAQGDTLATSNEEDCPNSPALREAKKWLISTLLLLDVSLTA